MQIIALDGNSNEVVTLPCTKMPMQGNGFKTVLGEVFEGTNPYTGGQVTADDVKALFLFNSSNKTMAAALLY